LPRPAGPEARRRAAIALAAVALLAWAPMARAVEEFLSQLKSVAEIRFHGRHQLSAKELRRSLRTPSPSIWPWADEVPLRLDFLSADTAGIRAAYVSHGYLDAVVDSVVVSPAPNKARPQVIVTYYIYEGERSTIRSVEISGNPNYPSEQLRKKLFARPGRPFNPGFMTTDTARISQAYQDRGYKPTVEAAAWRDSIDRHQVRVAYQVTEGRLYRFGAVYLSAPSELHVGERIIRRELVIKRGDVYRTSKVDESQQRLVDTGLFSQIHMTALPDSSNAVVEYDLRVRERKPRWIDAGIGSSTTERFSVSGDWGHRNIGRHAIQGSVSGRLSFDNKGRFLLAHLEGSVVEPWLFGLRVRGGVTPYYEHGIDRSDTTHTLGPRHYDLRGFKFVLGRDLALRTHLTLVQDNRYVDQSFEVAVADTVPRHYDQHSVLLGYEEDLRDNPVNPQLGTYLSALAQLSGGPVPNQTTNVVTNKGTYLFTKTQLLKSWYRPVHAPGWSAGWRLGGGIERPFGEVVGFTPGTIDADVKRVPSGDRFRLGGPNTVRGYNENDITPDGGLVMLIGNLELRVPIIGPFGLEAYIDGGNVWARPGDVKFGNLVPHVTSEPRDVGDVRYVLGAGGRLNLPFGPLRVDFTWNLQPDAGPSGRQWLVAQPQFAIGPSF